MGTTVVASAKWGLWRNKCPKSSNAPRTSLYLCLNPKIYIVFDSITGLFKPLFGTKSQREIKLLRREVVQINALYTTLESISHDELRAETETLRGEIREGLQTFDAKIAGLQEESKAAEDLKMQYALFQKIDRVKAKRSQKLHSLLDGILPRVFAIVKETARRFKEEEEIIVTANDFDRSMASEQDYVSIVGDKAHWCTTWDVDGQAVKWNMLHFDVQLMGGIVLHQGKIAEMGTGEGKTLVATLPAFLNALGGAGVHILTVNDYLAKRDAVWNAPIFEFHGISVGCIEGTKVQSPERKKAYDADITYGTNNGFGFDYLYDNIAKSKEEQVQRGHNYALIDEIDSAAIDEARTPLIISGPASSENDKCYRALNPRIKYLYQTQYKLVVGFLKEAKEKIADNRIREGGISLLRAHRGLPTYQPLIAYLSEKGIRKILGETEDVYLQENSKLMPQIDNELLFTIDGKYNRIELTDKGIESMTQKTDGEGDFFVLPDLAGETKAITEDTALTDEEKHEKKEELIQSFSEKTGRIHAVTQLLKAYSLYQKNKEYIVLDGEVKIVDEKTGRILGSRRYSDGLHQALEAKENVKIKPTTQTFASITPSNQFLMYGKLSGMTGTAKTEALELMDIYKLPVVSIPPNKPIRRQDLEDRLYKTKREKYHAIAGLVQKIKAKRRPILIITPSVEVSEEMRKLLNVNPKKVLNAKNHLLEAKIIAEAGKLEAITIATQMAGRGADIKLEPAAEEAGGLFVIIVEKSEVRRVDDQSRGRAGRQGQPGTSVCHLSLEDPLIVHWKHGPMGQRVDRVWSKEGEVLSDSTINSLITSVQQDKEQNHFASRKRTLEYDNVKKKQRQIIFRRRNNAIHFDRLGFDIMYAVRSTIIALIQAYERDKEQVVQASSEILAIPKEEIGTILGENTPKVALQKIYDLVAQRHKTTTQTFADAIHKKLMDVEEERMERSTFPIRLGELKMSVEVDTEKSIQTQGQHAVQQFHKSMVLSSIDLLWAMHLQHMDYLQEEVRNASYEQRSPLLVFKAEGLKMFQQLLSKINQHITRVILNYSLNVDEVAYRDSVPTQEQADRLEINRKEAEEASAAKPVVVEKSFNRNDRVTVVYTDGTTKAGVKYKTVAKDMEEGECKVVENDVEVKPAG